MAPDIFTYIYIYMFMWVRYTRVFVRGSFSLSYTSINVRICLHMYGFIPTYTEPAVCRSSLPGYISASNFNGDNPYICVCSVYVLMLLLLPPSAHLLSIPSLSISRYRASCILFKKRHHCFLTNFLFFLFFAMLLQCLLCFCCSYICVVFLCNSPLLYVFIRTYVFIFMGTHIPRLRPRLNIRTTLPVPYMQICALCVTFGPRFPSGRANQHTTSFLHCRLTLCTLGRI